jgi:hypothetical protein
MKMHSFNEFLRFSRELRHIDYRRLRLTDPSPLDPTTILRGCSFRTHSLHSTLYLSFYSSSFHHLLVIIQMISKSTTQSFASLLALVLLIQPVLAENWNPRVHVFPRDYVVPRTTERIPRSLKARAASGTVQPGQPTHTVPDSSILGFEVIGDTGVSAQQLFLGSDTKVCQGRYRFNPASMNIS